MSSFKRPARHPITGTVEDAFWIDDYYGRHKYGVRFQDGTVVPLVALDSLRSETNEECRTMEEYRETCVKNRKEQDSD